MKKDYYLIKERPRNNAGGRPTYYFKIENPHKPGHFARRSTGTSNRSVAVKHVEMFLGNPDAFSILFPENISQIERKEKLKFKDFAKDWWDWDKCLYIRARRNRSTADHPRIKRSYTELALIRKRKYLIPYFGEMALVDIKEFHVENFYKWLIDKGLSMKTINDIRSNLNIMLEWGKRNEMISINPVEKTLKFPVAKTKRELLSFKEAQALFSISKIQEIWEGNHTYYAAAFLSFLTGMREGEILALKPCCLLHYKFSDNNESFCINVTNSYSDKYGLSTTKNSEARKVPVPKSLYGLLLELSSIHKNMEGYIFSEDGDKPINSRNIRYYFCKALSRIGISEKERKRRMLTFHSLRSSFVTNNRNYGVPDTKIAAISGHKTLSILNTYTNYSNTDFREVNNLQEELEKEMMDIK